MDSSISGNSGSASSASSDESSSGATDSTETSGLTSGDSFGAGSSDAGGLQSSTDQLARSPTSAESLLAQSTPLDRLQDAPRQDTSADQIRDDSGGYLDRVGSWASRAGQAVLGTAEDAGEWAVDVNEEFGITTRAMGALSVVGGIGETALGTAGVVAPEPVTSIAGGVLAAHGVDTTVAGLRTIWTGESQQTLTQSGITTAAEAAGVDEVKAERLGVAVDIGVGLVNPANAVRHTGQVAMAEGLERAPEALAELGHLRTAEELSEAGARAVDDVARDLDLAADAASVEATVREFDTLEDLNRAANVPAAERADTVFKHGNYSWTTDAQGRVIHAGGEVTINSQGRTGSRMTARIGHEGAEGDIGFHLIGHQFNGPVNRVNVVPGNGVAQVLENGTKVSNLNQGKYYHEFEKKVRELADIAGNRVEVSVEPVYHAGNLSPRPDAFITRYRVNGGEWADRLFSNEAGG